MKIFVVVYFLATTLFAHPHTFIDVYPTIKVKNNKIVSLHFKWVMDEMTSSMLIMDFDQNGDGKINSKENFFIYSSYFVSLSDYDFYTTVKINGKVVKLPKPKNFKATIENHKICYSFDIKQEYNIKNTIFEFGDPDFYVAMLLKDKYVKIQGAKAKVSEMDNDFYFGYKLEFQIKN